MITGLTFNKIVSVELDRFNKITINVDGEEERVGVKEVPYVRYKFSEYDEDTLMFIAKMREKFDHSAHIVDVTVYQGMVQNLVAERIKNLFNNQVAVFGMIPINDNSLDSLEMLDAIVGGINKSTFDRFIIKDESTRLDFEKFMAIRKYLLMNHNIKDVGLCGSPFTNEENCCISAERARQIGAAYGGDDVATAVSTHQNMDCSNGCYCVRSYLVTSDLLPKESNKKATKEKKEPKEKTPKEKNNTPKEKKPAKPKIQEVPDVWF